MKKIIPPTTKESIVDTAFTALGLDQITQTDPQLMSDLLKETKLDSLKTSYPPLQRMLDDSKKEPQDLSNLVRQIKHGLTNNPVVSDFLKEAHKHGFLIKNTHFKKALHFAHLLENLTSAQANSNTAFKEIQLHYQEKRQEQGLDTKNIIKAIVKLVYTYRSFFKTAKTISVTPFMTKFKLERENSGKFFSQKEINKLKKEGKINFLEKILLMQRNLPKHMNNAALQLNILEAGMTEYKKGFKDNAFVAYALQKGSQQKEIIKYKEGSVTPLSYSGPDPLQESPDQHNFHPEYVFSKDWVDLYSSWNMGFVISDLDDLHLIMPKLFLPSQIDVKPEEYMFNRALSLDSVINFYLFRTFDKVKQVESPENRDEIAKIWGEINKKHAIEYVKEELGEDPLEFEKEFEAYYAKGMRKFIGLAKEFVLS